MEMDLRNVRKLKLERGKSMLLSKPHNSRKDEVEKDLRSVEIR